MAYTTTGNYLNMTFEDQSGRQTTRRIELGGLVVVTDDDANEWSAVSKSVVRSYHATNKQVDNGLVPDADSEVKDRARLYFRLPDNTKYHLDIQDPHDELFLSATGAGSNIIKDVADLALGGAAEQALATIIGKVLGGSILISDGETPTAYLGGERI